MIDARLVLVQARYGSQVADLAAEFHGYGDGIQHRQHLALGEFEANAFLLALGRQVFGDELLDRPFQAGSRFLGLGRIGDDPVHHVGRHVAIVAGHAHPSNQALIDRKFAEGGTDLVIQRCHCSASPSQNVTA